MTGTMDKLKAKVDNVLHKDKTTTTTTHNDPTGPHSSHAVNSADPRVDSDRLGTVGNTSGAGGVGAGQYGSNTTHTGTHTGAHTGPGLTGSHGTTHGSDPTGPHSSHMANQADPRVDSDRLGAAGNTSGAGGYGAGQYGSSNSHTTGGLTGGSHNTHNTHGSDPTGPHDSHMANKLEPRVDSDRVGPAGNSGVASYNTAGSGLGSHNTHGTTGSGVTGTHHNTYGSDPTGPHSSHLGNQADPRVDSDRYGAAGNTSGAGGYGAVQYGTNTGSGLAGSHGTHTGATVGSGNSNTTAGPHNSDMLNKIDPRVDSDLDGSKTYGGNQTYH